MECNSKIHGFTRQEQGKFHVLSDKRRKGSRTTTNRQIAVDVAKREVIGEKNYSRADKETRRKAFRFALAFGGK